MHIAWSLTAIFVALSALTALPAQLSQEPDAKYLFTGAAASNALGSSVASAGDVNGDDVVNVTDLVAVILAWGSVDASGDATADGLVDVLDLLRVILEWGACST